MTVIPRLFFFGILMLMAIFLEYECDQLLIARPAVTSVIIRIVTMIQTQADIFREQLRLDGLDLS